MEEQEVFFKQKAYEFEYVCPLDIREIFKNQRNDAELKKLKENPKQAGLLGTEKVRGVQVVTYRGKTYFPKKTRNDLVEWFHDNLQHRDRDLTLNTIKNNFNWPGMTADVTRHVEGCTLCQEYKITGQKKYGKIPIQENKEEIEPWQYVYMDCIGPWKVQYKFMETNRTMEKQIEALMAVDQGTSFSEIWPLPDKYRIIPHIITIFNIL